MAATKAKVMKDEGVGIKLGGKNFTVKFDLNALCNMQEAFGDIEAVFKEGLEMRDLKKIRSLLHIGLANGENEEVTEKEVGALITMHNLGDVMEALTKAFGDAMPIAKEGK